MALTGPPALERVLRRFRIDGDPVSAAPLPGGHINTTYRVDFRASPGTAPCLLQRINEAVFPEPERVAENGSRVARHIARRLELEGARDAGRRVLTHVPALEGRDWIVDDDGGCWRMFHLVPGSRTLDRAQSPRDAREAARAFGEFLRLLADPGGPLLHETLPRFHDTAWRFAQLDDAVRRDPHNRAAGARAELDAALRERSLAGVLAPRIGSDVPPRIAHNDAKLSNVLFDEGTGEALCVIDLDTVMPGSALYDFGDLVRSTVSPVDEDAEDLGSIAVRSEMFAALVRGYLETGGAVLTASERALLVRAGRVLTVEQAVRFLTDHLEGDRYYRIARAGHNLARARAQLRLYGLLTEQASRLEAVVEEVVSELLQ